MYIIRTYSAGVFAGEIASRNGKEAEIRNARRLWLWRGAASLSELATRGSSTPAECKFPAPVPGLTLVTEVIEIIPMTDEAIAKLAETPAWSA